MYAHSHSHTHTLTYDVVVHGVGGVSGRDLVVGVQDPQLSRVLKRMFLEAKLEEEATKGPDVGLYIDWLVAIEIHHLWCSVHWSRVALDLNSG